MEIDGRWEGETKEGKGRKREKPVVNSSTRDHANRCVATAA